MVSDGPLVQHGRSQGDDHIVIAFSAE